MKKTLLRIALAAGLVGAVNLAMDSKNEASAQQVANVSQIAAPDDYTITDPAHPAYQEQFDASQIAEQCPGVQRLCATPREGSGLPNVNWDGNTTKF